MGQSHIIVMLKPAFLALCFSLLIWVMSPITGVGAESDSMTVQVTIGTDDSDDDGMGDDWEQQIIDADGGDPITSIGGVLPDDDFDVDGLSNLEEFLLGTDPTDPASLLEITAITFPSNGNVRVVWQSSTNTVPLPRKYDIICADTPFTLLSSSTIVDPNVPSAGMQTESTFTRTSTNTRVYTVVLPESLFPK